MTGFSMADVLSARDVIRGVAARTPTVPAARTVRGHPFLLKLETVQPTGAFKLRGAVNAVFRLDGDGCAGVACASTGNHGRGVAYAARERGMRAVVCMSEMALKPKVEKIRELGADARVCGADQAEAEAASLRIAREEGLAWISAFDDPHVIAGQATIGLEILEDRADLDMVLVPLSGGGMAAGVAFAAKTIKPDARVIGVSMDRGPGMKAALDAGRPVEVEEYLSLADSLGGGIGAGNRMTFGMCREYLDDVALVSEEELYDAIQALYHEEALVVEGGGAVGVAAVMAGKIPEPKGPVVAVVSGRNADMRVHAKIVAGQTVRLGDLEIGGRTYRRR